MSLFQNPILSGSGINLRAVEPDDIRYIFETENDETLWGVGYQRAPASMLSIESYVLNYDADPLKNGELRLIIEKQNDHSRIGIIDLYRIDPYTRTACLGIYISSIFQGKGFGKRAINIISYYSYEILGLRVIAAEIASSNSMAISVFEHCQFQKTGLFPQWIIYRGCINDMIIYSKILQYD